MRRKISPAVLSAVAGLALLGHAGLGGAQTVLATGPDAELTEDGLHRVHPAIMEAAWIKPDLDLSKYTRILLMPTAVQFREVRDRPTDARSRISTETFPVAEDRQEWLRDRWRRAVETRFAREDSYELYDGAGSSVLVVQGFLVDVVSRIPPDTIGSSYTLVTDPWSVSVVLELRDGATAELIARTVDRRNARGLLEVGAVWHQTEDLVERWAQVLADRLEQLAQVTGPGRRTRLGPQ